MTKSQRKQEEIQLNEAVSTLCDTLRLMARKKAHDYEMEFLLKVRQAVDDEIEICRDCYNYKAKCVNQKAIELLTPNETDENAV